MGGNWTLPETGPSPCVWFWRRSISRRRRLSARDWPLGRRLRLRGCGGHALVPAWDHRRLALAMSIPAPPVRRRGRAGRPSAGSGEHITVEPTPGRPDNASHGSGQS